MAVVVKGVREATAKQKMKTKRFRMSAGFEIVAHSQQKQQTPPRKEKIFADLPRRQK